MRSIYKRILLTITCFLFLSTTYAQLTPIEEVGNAIRNSKVADISKYFETIVSLTINSNQTGYSKAQAEVVLKDFFNKNAPSEFILINSGSTNDNSRFAIGKLNTTNGRFSVYLLFRIKDGIYTLQELRLNKE